MDFLSIFNDVDAWGPVAMLIAAGMLFALGCFVEFIGKTLARFYSRGGTRVVDIYQAGKGGQK